MNKLLIAELLEPFGILRQPEGEISIHEVLLFEPGAEDARGRAYVVCDHNAQGKYRFSAIIAIGETKIKSPNMFLLSEGTVSHVLNCLIQVLWRLERLNESLYAAQDSQAVIDIAAEKTKLPFFYFDDSYKIIAISHRIYYEMDDEWKHMTEKGYLSPNTTRLMRENGDLDFLAATNEPVIYDSPLFPFVCVSCNVKFRNSFRGRINMLVVDRDAFQEHIALCSIVQAHLLRLIQEGKVPDDRLQLRNLLTDILIGNRVTDLSAMEILRDNAFDPEAQFQLFAVDIHAGEDPQLFNYYAQLIERGLAGYRLCVFPYDDRMMILALVGNSRAGQAISEQIENITTHQNLTCGASHRFYGLERMRGYCGQAMFALEKAVRGQMVIYEKVQLERLFSFVPEDQTEYLLSDKYLALRRADRENSFPMAETVWCYLKNGCNLSATASELSVHKNTMLYRLKKIEDLLEIDLNDFNTRLALELSFSIQHSMYMSTARS